MQVRLDVDAGGSAQAAFAEAPGLKLPVPLVLQPAFKAEYFDVRYFKAKSVGFSEALCAHKLICMPHTRQ